MYGGLPLLEESCSEALEKKRRVTSSPSHLLTEDVQYLFFPRWATTKSRGWWFHCGRQLVGPGAPPEELRFLHGRETGVCYYSTKPLAASPSAAWLMHAKAILAA